jgi:hypothetical protein
MVELSNGGAGGPRCQRRSRTRVGHAGILRVHLIPIAGRKRLDAITNEDVQRLKMWLRAKAPKTVNNVLAVLSRLLKTAVEWGVLDRMPCAIRLLPAPKGSTAFFDSWSTNSWSKRLGYLIGGPTSLRSWAVCRFTLRRDACA